MNKLIVRLLIFLSYASINTIQAQLANVMENQDLSEYVVYRLVDLCAEKKDDGLEIIKEFKKSILGLLLTNKKINHNVRLLIDEKASDENKKTEIANPRAKQFLDYCTQKIVPKIKLLDLRGIYEDGTTTDLPLSTCTSFKISKFQNILFYAHFASPLATKTLKNEISDLSPKQLEIALNIADHFVVTLNPPCNKTPIYTHCRKVGEELTRSLVPFPKASLPILLEILLIPEAPLYFPGIFPHKNNKHSQ